MCSFTINVNNDRKINLSRYTNDLRIITDKEFALFTFSFICLSKDRCLLKVIPKVIYHLTLDILLQQCCIRYCPYFYFSLITSKCSILEEEISAASFGSSHTWSQFFFFFFFFFVVQLLRISLYSVSMRGNKDQKKLCIWTPFTQC